MTFNTLPKFAGAFFNWLSRITCGSLMLLLTLATPLPAVDLLYVTLSNNTIVAYDTTSGVSATIAASVTTFASTNLSVPYGLAFDSSGNLYAANISGTYGNTISKFSSSGAHLGNISSNLNGPCGLVFDTSGNLYATNYFGNTISKFDASDQYVSNITTNLKSPTGLAFDSSGNLYAANYNFSGSTISKFDASGSYVSNITTNLNSPVLWNPVALAFDTSGNLYAANYDNQPFKLSISKFSSSGAYLSTRPTN